MRKNMKNIVKASIYIILLPCIILPSSSHTSFATTSKSVYELNENINGKSIYPAKNTSVTYIPNQLIVKLKRSSANALADGISEGKTVRNIKLPGKLNDLGSEHKVRKARQICKNFKQRHKKHQALLEKAPSELTKKEKQIVRRIGRAEINITVPDLDRIFLFEFDTDAPDRIQMALLDYKNNPEVEYAEFNYIVSIDSTPNDPYYSVQWALNNMGQDYPISGGLSESGTLGSDIDAPEAWDIVSVGTEVIVAVVDSGVDYNHSDLGPRMWSNTAEIAGNGIDDDGNGFIDDIYGYDFVNKDSDPIDDNGHGTHCSGIIAADPNNGIDISGLCHSTKIMGLKFLGSDGTGSTADAVEALYYATDNGADVMSNSWGGSNFSQTMQDAINYGYSQGVIMLASAGNDNSSSIYYPACYDHIVSVAAVDSSDLKASFSNYGSWVDVSAPGVNILSLRAQGTDIYLGSIGYTPGDRFIPYGDPNATMYIASGTSMACPYTVGLAALILSKNPAWGESMVIGQILGTSDDINSLNLSYSGMLGAGRINAYKALTMPPQPSLVSKGFTVYDDLTENRVNGGLDPGETVELSIALKNVWADAANVNATLSTTDPLVTINKNTAAYGDINSGQTKENDLNRFGITLSPLANIGHQISFDLDITATDYSVGRTVIIELQINQLPGWPLTFDTWKSGAPTLSDIDNDGSDEVIFGMDNELYIVKGDGTNYPNWPQETANGTYEIPFAIVGDIDGDGDKEIIAAVNKPAGIPECHVYAWHYESGLAVTGWPQNIGSGMLIKDIALGEIDGDDTDLEIIILREKDTVYDPTRLYVFKGDGSNVSGWPKDLNSSSEFRLGNIAIGDIDNNGNNEIVAAFGTISQTGWVYVYRNDGTLMPGWPITTNGYSNSPVLHDMDSDGELEILSCTATGAVEDGRLHAWKLNGQSVPGWPVFTKGLYLSAGDVDGDGKVEFVTTDSMTSYVKSFDDDGKLIWETNGSQTPATICDIDNDGEAEIFFGGYRGFQIYGFDHHGNYKTGFPVDINYYLKEKPPVFGDINGDGTLELVAITGSTGPYHIHVFDLPGPVPLQTDWPMFKHDDRRSANMSNGAFLSFTDINRDGKQNFLDYTYLAGDWQYNGWELFEPNEVNLWSFDEGTGVVVHDSIGGREGYFVGTPDWIPGHDGSGSAVNLDNANSEYITVTDYKGISGSQSRTCSAWVKTDTSIAGLAILYWGSLDAGGTKWSFMLSDGSKSGPGALQVDVRNGHMIGTTDIRDGQWHHVAAVMGGCDSPNISGVKLYVDGIEELYSYVESRPVNTGSKNDVLIGARKDDDGNMGYYFDGQIDDVRIYDYALTAEMVGDLYNGLDPSGPVCMEYPAADFVRDCVIDVNDFCIFADQWLLP
jgi:subtilisin family serine protease